MIHRDGNMLVEAGGLNTPPTHIPPRIKVCYAASWRVFLWNRWSLSSDTSHISVGSRVASLCRRVSISYSGSGLAWRWLYSAIPRHCCWFQTYKKVFRGSVVPRCSDLMKRVGYVVLAVNKQPSLCLATCTFLHHLFTQTEVCNPEYDSTQPVWREMHIPCAQLQAIQLYKRAIQFPQSP